ncbi:MAG TPA: dephospho-CoA kinase [Acidobacteriota bacterium]|nr:dephospho-CoA kinase [Acidobacteriota bacterium]
MLTVGLTGGICCGKSAVTSMFAELGCFIVDADLISRKIVEPGAPTWSRIVKFFGPEILNKDKSLNRKKLGSIIFADAEKRKALNAIMHPLILKEEERLIRDQKNKHAITIVSAALMMEVGTYRRYKKIIVVFCKKEIQIMRMMKRENLTRKEALQRIHSQLSSAERKRHADYAIDTSGPFPQTRKQVVRVYEKLRRLAEKSR